MWRHRYTLRCTDGDGSNSGRVRDDPAPRAGVRRGGLRGREPALQRLVDRQPPASRRFRGPCGIDSLLHLGDSEAPAEIFKGDAPDARLWAQWRERGWVREASHYLKLGANVQCKTCPNNCILEP